VTIRGLGEFFTLHDKGHQTCDNKGTTTWVPEPKAGLQHAYLVKKDGVDDKVTETLETLIQAEKRKQAAERR